MLLSISRSERSLSILCFICSSEMIWKFNHHSHKCAYHFNQNIWLLHRAGSTCRRRENKHGFLRSTSTYQALYGTTPSSPGLLDIWCYCQWSSALICCPGSGCPCSRGSGYECGQTWCELVPHTQADQRTRHPGTEHVNLLMQKYFPMNGMLCVFLSTSGISTGLH